MSLLAASPLVRDLARLLAGWLAVIVFVQAMAAAAGLVQGPRHRHLGDTAAAGAVFVHAAGGAHDDEEAHDQAHHAQAHHDQGGWARHVHHSPIPEPVLHDDAQELAAAAGLVLSAMVALAPLRHDFRGAGAGHVMRASPAWSCITHAAPFPERPPRA